MYSRPWVIVTVILCVIFAVLAFPIFVKVKGVPTAIAYTLIGFAVIWFAYFVRAWVFSRPGSRNAKKNKWFALFLLFIIVGFAASNARPEDPAPRTLTPTDEANHLNLLKQLSSDQVKALSDIYPDFRILMLCSGRFSGVDRDELVLGIWKLQESERRWKSEVHRVGLIWGPSGWEAHIIDDEIEEDEETSGVYPMSWHYTLNANGFSAEMKCGLESGIEGDPNLTYDLGDKPFFDLKEKGLSSNKLVCYATDDVYNNWDCVVYSPEDGRFLLWFQQAHAD